MHQITMKFVPLSCPETIKYFPAKAAVVNGELKVWSDKVKEPTIVRYGWQPFTRANLVNGAGLPASTFRSDVK